ncbi:MAG: DNA polymerase III subunit delta [Nitrospirae bacterium]|nr:DNA polymerase III subunit delta [Nitrospirota bacterium]
MSFQEFFKEIERQLPSQVYLLYASDHFLLREAVIEIKKFVPFEQREFNFHVFDFSSPEEKFSIEQVIDVANTAPFFSKRRFIVLIGNLQRLLKNGSKRLHSYLSNPAPFSIFFLCHEGAFKKEMRERFKGLKTISLDIKESDIPSWIKCRTRSKGFEISDIAVDYLLGVVGPDLGLLSAEIEKISLLGKSASGVLSVDDISKIIEGNNSYTPFNLVEALEERNTEKVFRIYKTLRQTTETYNIIGILNWLYGRLMSMDRRDKGDKYILKTFEILHSADIDIKSSGRDFPMEYLLLKLLRL